MRAIRKAIASLFFVPLLLVSPALAQARRRTPARPKLVVILVADQMRADYIEKYGHHWTKGLRRLLDGGAWFSQAAYPYWNTVTCPGHATIGTGTFPAKHGMVLNAWWDRVSGKQVSCTEDAAVANITAAGPRSPGDTAHQLLMPTLADEMRRQQAQPPRIVSLSFKARSAIGLAGHGGDAVVWYAGGWQTSGAYAQEWPAFVQEFASTYHVGEELRKTWKRALPERAYLFEDDAAGEQPSRGDTRTFPHAVNIPVEDVALAELAKAAVDGLRLGRRAGTDFLAVGFSALDEAGHRFGPRSHEVQDTLVRLDAVIGDLLTYLDRKVGAENYVLAFSSDHGVAEIPEQLLAEGLDAGRVSTSDLVQAVEKALEPYLGPGPHVDRYTYTDLYFKPGVYAKLRDNAEAMRAVEQAILSVRGTWRVLRGDDLPGRRDSSDPAERAAALSYYPNRSGDVIVLAKPNWFAASAATTHGSGHAYDQRVPVILMGGAIQPGEYRQPATPADIAPTLAFLCGITLPNADGRVLTEALAPLAPPRKAAALSEPSR